MYKNLKDNELRQEITMLKERVCKTEEKIKTEEKFIRSNKKCIQEIAKDISKEDKKLVQLQELFEKYNNYYKIQIENILGEIRKRITIQQLSESQNALSKKIEDSITSILNHMAQKKQTKKALIFLEHRVIISLQINQLISVVNQKKEAQDSLFVKKPFSCASCDRRFQEFSGKLGEYKAWQSIPFKQQRTKVKLKIIKGKKQQQHNESIDKIKQVMTVNFKNHSKSKWQTKGQQK